MPQQREWTPDTALPGFEQTSLKFPDDYDGAVKAVLVRRQAPASTQGGARRAFLHIHGYVDYFFQVHEADHLNAQGYDFYALDLRKYGRALSLDEVKHPNFCKDIHEYFADITAALRVITEEDGYNFLVVEGHSTGGLIAALYAHEGEDRGRINGLFLNSPFFDWNVPSVQRFALSVLSVLSSAFPYLSLKQTKPVPFFESIHKSSHGEWDFDLRYRPLTGFPIYAGWVRAITRAHGQVKQGLSPQCPVLVMHSDKSVYGATWHPGFQMGDGVLSIDHIKEGSKHLGKNVKVVEIPDAMHDVTLSRADVREKAFAELSAWLGSL